MSLAEFNRLFETFQPQNEKRTWDQLMCVSQEMKNPRKNRTKQVTPPVKRKKVFSVLPSSNESPSKRARESVSYLDSVIEEDKDTLKQLMDTVKLTPGTFPFNVVTPGGKNLVPMSAFDISSNEDWTVEKNRDGIMQDLLKLKYENRDMAPVKFNVNAGRKTSKPPLPRDVSLSKAVGNLAAGAENDAVLINFGVAIASTLRNTTVERRSLLASKIAQAVKEFERV